MGVRVEGGVSMRKDIKLDRRELLPGGLEGYMAFS